MDAVVALAHRMFAEANLPASLLADCTAALRKSGRLFSGTPNCARIALGWIDALAPACCDRLYPAVVAADCMYAAYDLFDAVYDQDDLERARRHALPAGVTLLNLAQEAMRRVAAPADRRLTAAASLAHGGRRAFAGHVRDYACRGGPVADANSLLWVVRQRSGSLIAASCAAMALVAGATWRQVGLAARFGRAVAVAGQLEDDLADRQIDAALGRQTIPTLLGASATDEVVHATTWVLIRQNLYIAARAVITLEATRPEGSTEALWQVLPAAVRPTVSEMRATQ